jgi:ABC-type transport system involved in multi-copper enzyme maturation permease subunit
MTAAAITPVLRAEWTKFRTVRGWVAGLIAAALLTAGVGLLSHGECGGQQQLGGPVTTGGPQCSSPLGPGGEAVTDSFYFARQPLGPDGSITARLTSLASPGGWSKAGIMIKASTTPGSAYAAMMVTGGHGVRMQWDFTQDTPGLPGGVSAAAPRWLRLTRSGGTVTGYDSADGTHWVKVSTATLPGLPRVAQAGLFAASPGSSTTTGRSIGGATAVGAQTQATAAFDRIAVSGAHPAATSPAGVWAGTSVGAAGGGPAGGFRQAGGAVTVTGSGDIAPAVPDQEGSVSGALVGAFAGLIAVVVLGAVFVTAEYRRGLIRVTLAASPSRGRVLAAKAAVIGAVTFAVALPAGWIAQLIQEPMARSRGIFIAPVSTLTDLRVLTGTAALLALGAVLAVALGVITRRGAAAVTAALAVIVFPYFFAVPLAVLPAGAADWLLRVTPAAGFAVQQAYPRYPQVAAAYTAGSGYYPLSPWAGFAVLCAWTAVALVVAAWLLHRRDA